MSSFINLFKIYFISFFSFWSDENVDPVLNIYVNSEVVNHIPEKDKPESYNPIKSFNNKASRVIGISSPKRKFSNLELDSKISVLYFRLRKNLETLVYLSELESQFDDKFELSQVIQQYNTIKKSIQVDTIEISNELAYYRALQQDACA